MSRALCIFEIEHLNGSTELIQFILAKIYLGLSAFVLYLLHIVLVSLIVLLHHMLPLSFGFWPGLVRLLLLTVTCPAFNCIIFNVIPLLAGKIQLRKNV